MEIKRGKGYITVLDTPKIEHFLITGLGQIRGVAKCDPRDVYNEQFGINMAQERAKEKLNQKRLKYVTNEIEVFDREVAILRNRLVKRQQKLMKKLGVTVE